MSAIDAAVAETTNGQQLKPKPNGRIAEIERKLDVLAWLHAELVFGIKLAAAQQMLNNPQIQQAVAAQIAASLNLR